MTPAEWVVLAVACVFLVPTAAFLVWGYREPPTDSGKAGRRFTVPIACDGPRPRRRRCCCHYDD